MTATAGAGAKTGEMAARVSLGPFPGLGRSDILYGLA
jgi:hypothetical protein